MSDPADKPFSISAAEIRELIADDRPCFASARITVDGEKVGYMYREEPDEDHSDDSGWRFLAGDEDDDYCEDPDNFAIYAINTICNYDPAIIPYLSAPFGTAFGRVEGTEEFEAEEFDPSDDE